MHGLESFRSSHSFSSPACLTVGRARVRSAVVVTPRRGTETYLLTGSSPSMHSWLLLLLATQSAALQAGGEGVEKSMHTFNVYWGRGANGAVG